MEQIVHKYTAIHKFRRDVAPFTASVFSQQLVYVYPQNKPLILIEPVSVEPETVQKVPSSYVWLDFQKTQTTGVLCAYTPENSASDPVYYKMQFALACIVKEIENKTQALQGHIQIKVDGFQACLCTLDLQTLVLTIYPLWLLSAEQQYFVKTMGYIALSALKQHISNLSLETRVVELLNPHVCILQQHVLHRAEPTVPATPVPIEHSLDSEPLVFWNSQQPHVVHYTGPFQWVSTSENNWSENETPLHEYSPTQMQWQAGFWFLRMPRNEFYLLRAQHTHTHFPVDMYLRTQQRVQSFAFWKLPLAAFLRGLLRGYDTSRPFYMANVYTTWVAFCDFALAVMQFHYGGEPLQLQVIKNFYLYVTGVLYMLNEFYPYYHTIVPFEYLCWSSLEICLEIDDLVTLVDRQYTHTVTMMAQASQYALSTNAWEQLLHCYAEDTLDNSENSHAQRMQEFCDLCVNENADDICDWSAVPALFTPHTPAVYVIRDTVGPLRNTLATMIGASLAAADGT